VLKNQEDQFHTHQDYLGAKLHHAPTIAKYLCLEGRVMVMWFFSLRWASWRSL